MLTNDPAKWIVVGMLACLHFTFCAWRNSVSPFTWRNTATGVAIVISIGCCCGVIPLVSAHPIWGPTVAICCGLLLSGRQNAVNAQVGHTLAGIFIGLIFVCATTSLSTLPQYSGSEASWEVTPYDGLPIIDRSDRSHYPAGYADSPTFGDDRSHLHGPFRRIIPKPLWHSFLTGVYGRVTRDYRVWLPEGRAADALDGALAVPVGTPPGLEQERGLFLAFDFDLNEYF